MRKDISTSTYSFEKLRQEDFIYVDKTKYIYEMVRPGTAQIFCARPRRFGKSLMVSTLEALFSGRRDLFEGLYIAEGKDESGEPINYSFEEYPVIHIDLSGCDSTSRERLEAALKDAVTDIAEDYDISLKDDFASLMFKNLIRKLAKQSGKRVVLLLDEYDKPLTDNIDRPALTEIREELESFYGVIKSQEKNFRFTFITGVTKFSQVSIFSKLNNLTDISLSADAAEMFGYTQEELETYFGEYIDQAVRAGVRDRAGNRLSREAFLEEVRAWYDGFRFYPTAESVYNPVSVGDFFNSHFDFGYYWYSTGTSSWLEKLARKQPLTMEETTGIPIPKSVFAEFLIENFAGGNYGRMDVLKLLYQTGYLTLALDREFLHGPDNPYHLTFPNKEVREAYLQLLLKAWFPSGQDYIRSGILQALEEGDTDLLRQYLEGFYASIPYELFPAQDREKTYQMMMYILFTVIGETVRVEEHTNRGRIDVVLEGKKQLYVMECKLDRSAEEALEQIEEKDYARKYMIPARAQGKDIVKIGVNFSSEKKNIDDWKVEKL